MVEPVEYTTRSLQGQFASCDAATACLARLSLRDDAIARLKTDRSSIDLAGDTITLSQLVPLAAEFGLQAEWVQYDWQGLKTAVSAHSLLVVRNNGEVVAVTGGGRSGAEEISVWDPHHDGVVFFVSREDFERTWSGHALLIVSEGARANIFDTSSTSPEASKRHMPPRESWVPVGLSLGVAATALVASLGMVLFLLTSPDGDQAAGSGTPTRVGSAGPLNPPVYRRQAASAADSAGTTPVVTTPEAASISAAPSSGH